MVEIAAAYLDDIVIHSSSWEEHLAHLCAVLELLALLPNLGNASLPWPIVFT